MDNRVFLYLGDGSVNEGFLTEDGIHLTNAASNRLAKNLELRLKSETAGVCRDTPSVSRDGIDTRRKAQGNRNGPVNNTPGEDPRCYYSYERGHVKANCRHGREVRCHSCGRLGHKEKFCGSA